MMSRFNIIKRNCLIKRNFTLRVDDEDVWAKFTSEKSMKESKLKLEEWEKIQKDRQDANLRKAHEIAREKREEFRKLGREFVLNMTVPGVKPAEKISISALANGFFSVNGLWMPGSILAFPNRAFMWGVVDAHEIKEHTLDVLKIIKPRPNYFIIGTGKYMVEFDESFFQHFRKHRMLVEVMPTIEAVSQFNIYNEDGWDVGAALIPNNL